MDRGDCGQGQMGPWSGIEGTVVRDRRGCSHGLRGLRSEIKVALTQCRTCLAGGRW